MSLFDVYEKSLTELKGQSASYITHGIKTHSDATMIDSLLDALSSLKDEKDASVRTAGVVFGVCGIAIGAISTHCIQAYEESKKRKKKGLVAGEKVKQEIQALESKDEDVIKKEQNKLLDEDC